MLGIFAVPAGLGTFILGAATLELGTFTFNVVLLLGKDAGADVPPSVKHFAEVLYGFGMPLSNVIGIAQWIYFASQDGLKGTLWVWGFGTCWTCLIIGREQVHLARSVPYFLRRWGWWASKGAKAKGGEKKRVAGAPAGATTKKTQ